MLSMAELQSSKTPILLSYTPPEWTSGLKNCPKYRTKLCQLPTPIHEWSPPGLNKDNGGRVFIKRDDMTSSDCSGSKIRKMEFVMASAISSDCDAVVTTGPIHSNHCRTVAVSSRQLGLQPHIVLRTTPEKGYSIGHRGNLLLNRLVGANILNAQTTPTFDFKAIDDKLHEYGDKLRSEGIRPFIIPLNLPDVTGLWGYLELYQELMTQGILGEIDHVFVACASCATVLGIALGAYLTGSHIKVHGICVCETAEYFYSESDKYLQELGVLGSSCTSRDIMTLYEYIGAGYCISTDEELEYLHIVAKETGIILDRIYTVKAVKGMLNELNTKPEVYHGSKGVLFIHTGGIHTLHNGGVLDDRVKDLTDGMIITCDDCFK